MATIKEIKQNIFTLDDKYYLAHCISADCAMGAGIAVQFQSKFKLRNKLLQYDDSIRKYPTCILIGKVFNLITKKKYWHKPTYDSLAETLKFMKNIIVDKNIKYIAMPKIGCGLDRLQWGKVKEIIEKTFKDLDIEILVCEL